MLHTTHDPSQKAEGGRSRVGRREGADGDIYRRERGQRIERGEGRGQRGGDAIVMYMN